MVFINTPIDINVLPAADNLELQPLHADYYKVLRIEWLITSAVFVLIALCLSWWVFSFKLLPVMVLAFSALLLIFVHWFYLYKSFPLAGYALREKDVVYKRGWVIQSLRICPFNRIQNCTVQSGPIERRYSLASVIVYTAGSAGADMKIHGLKSEEADRLRQFILQQIHKEDEVL